MGNYVVLITKKARKQLLKLPENIATRLEEKMLALTDNPRPSGCKKLSGYELYRIRVGKYRIVYEIKDEVLTVTVVKIGHRSGIYD